MRPDPLRVPMLPRHHRGQHGCRSSRPSPSATVHRQSCRGLLRLLGRDREPGQRTRLCQGIRGRAPGETSSRHRSSGAKLRLCAPAGAPPLRPSQAGAPTRERLRHGKPRAHSPDPGRAAHCQLRDRRRAGWTRPLGKPSTAPSSRMPTRHRFPVRRSDTAAPPQGGHRRSRRCSQRAAPVPA